MLPERRPYRTPFFGSEGTSDVAVIASLQKNTAADKRLEDAKAYRSELVRADPIVAFVATKHPRSRRRRVAFADLAEATLVAARAWFRHPRKLVEAEIAARALVPRERIVIESREGAREPVAAGLGIGVVSRSEFVPDPRLRLLRFADLKIEMREWLVCLSSRESLHLIGAFPMTW